MANKRALPAKESAAFKNLLHLYETRAYKQALKVADQILKKIPDHGETTSMKGLVLTNLQRREEGIQLVKKGALLDVTSHICWHVYGIVHKADHNYDEALKCYIRALKFDKENVNILRDAAQLQQQLRQYEALLDTRQALLRLRPNARAGWIGLAVAYELNGRSQEARKVLEQYLTVLKGVPERDVEFSELMIYYVNLIEKAGDLEGALQVLDSNAKSRTIADKTAIKTARARILMNLDRLDEATTEWRGLLQQNPECHEYYKWFLLAQDIDLDSLNDEQRTAALSALKALEADMPQATAPKRLALSIASGNDFKALVEKYLSDGLTRGIPSLFADLKSLYHDPSKISVIETAVLAFCSRYTNDETPEDPTPFVWANYYLAQHHSQISPVHGANALRHVDAAISHTPTLPELYMLKARILKRCGDPVRAAHVMDEARKLDLQDRFLNTKSAKYFMRDGQTEIAISILGLFTKKDAASPGADLEEMQSLFYLSEEGESFRKQGKLSLALKRYRTVEKTFADFEDDQFDFHSYCLRRHTLTAYHGLLKLEDTLRSHPAYVNAALAATEIYLRIHDDRAGTIALATVSLGDAHKKQRRKAKKSDKKAPPANTVGDDKDLPPPPPKDEDPDGMKLLQAPDALEQAYGLVKPLETLCPHTLRVWYAVYDITFRRGKYLQAIKALKAAYELAPDDLELHHRLVHFKMHCSRSMGLDGVLRSVVARALAALIPDDTPLDIFNSSMLQRQPGSPTALLSAARALLHIRGPEGLSEVEELLFQIPHPETQLSIEAASGALNLLTTLQSIRLEDFRAALNNKYPRATVFMSEADRAGLRNQLSVSPDADEPVGPI